MGLRIKRLLLVLLRIVDCRKVAIQVRGVWGYVGCLWGGEFGVEGV